MDKKINIYFFQNIIMVILSFTMILALVAFTPITPYDELWNFQNTYKIFNGFTIYSDANIIVTPLFFYLGNLLFHIFSPTILTFRIFTILIYVCLFFTMYRIVKNLKTCKNLNILFLIFTFLFIFHLLVGGANYNTLATLFSLIGLYLYIGKKSNNIFQGFIIFLVFFTKQNMGIFYVLIVLTYELYDKGFTKQYFLDQLKKFFLFLIPSSLVILHLYLNGKLLDFINYCFGGLFEFAENNIAISASPFYFAILLTTLGTYIFTIIKRNSIFKDFSNNFFNNLTLLFIFAIGHTLLVYPIINSAHIILALPYHFLFIFYYFDTLIFNDIFNDDKYKTGINWFSIALLLIILIRTVFYFVLDYKTLVHYDDKSSPYNGFFISNDRYEKIITLKQYILEKNSKNIDVIIFSFDSALPMIELKQSHGVYDLLFNGNLGYNGKEKIKEDILNRKNTEFLVVTNEEDLFSQEPPEIRDFIIDNLNFKGTICNYSIYSK